jgi:peroxiredoxin Q/BCP
MPGLVRVVIPAAIIPLRELVVGALIQSLGRLAYCHCLSVLALTVRLIAAGRTRVNKTEALLFRHRCQSSVIRLLLLVRDSPSGLLVESGRRFLGAHSARSGRVASNPLSPYSEVGTFAQREAALADPPDLPGKTRWAGNTEPPKATKGRRMSKKTRKKSVGPSPAKEGRAKAARAMQKPGSKTRPMALKSAKKSSKATVKKAAAKKAGKARAKTTPKTARKAASKKAASQSARAKKSTPETAVTTQGKAATPATKIPVATLPPKEPTAIPSHGTPATEGGPAPSFNLPRDGGERVSLADYAGQKLVIFFYPRADTPGCTREAIDFTRLNGDFAAAGTAVLGVSADPVKTQESFRNKHQLSVPLISDETHDMLQAYGAWGEKSMYGRTFQGILRTTVLIDGSGRIARIWHGVKVDGHADTVLAAAREL